MQEAYFFVSRSLTMLQAAIPLASKAPASVLPLNIGPCLVHLQQTQCLPFFVKTSFTGIFHD